MNIINILATILNSVIIIFLLSVIFIKDQSSRAQKKRKKKERKKNVSEVLDKYIENENKKQLKKKYSRVSNLINETEKKISKTVKKKVKLVESTEKRKDKKLMKKGSDEYNAFTSGLHTALPRIEEELKQDIEDLQEVVTTLESLDKDSKSITKKKIGVGLGIFYDKMARRFQQIIKENSLDDFKFIPIQRLKYHIANQIKNLKDDDFLPVLNIMKETKLIQDLIEINPTLSFILFSDEKLELTESEKVTLSFSYEEDVLTLDKLLEITQWSEDYTLKTLKKLIKKNLLGMVDDIIKVESFEPLSERKKWNQVIQEFLEREKESKEKKFQKALLKRKRLEKKLIKLKMDIAKNQSEEKIDKKKEKHEKKIKEPQFGSKPIIKNLYIKKKLEDENIVNQQDKIKEIQNIKDKDSLIEAMEELDKEMKYSEAKRIESDKEKDDSDLSINIRNIAAEQTSNLEDDISETILNFDEKYSMMNGGFVQYEKIRDYIYQKYKNVDESLIKKILIHLVKLKMINRSLKIGKFTFYLFKEFELDEMERNFILKTINKQPKDKEYFVKELDWDEEQILEVMKTLQKKGIFRLEGNKVILPGIIQNDIEDDFIIF